MAVDMFFNFNLVRNNKIDYNLATIKAGGKNKHKFEILWMLVFWNVCLTQFENNQILRLNYTQVRFHIKPAGLQNKQ